MKYKFEYVDREAKTVGALRYDNGELTEIPIDAEYEIKNYDIGYAIITYNDVDYYILPQLVGFHEMTKTALIEWITDSVGFAFEQLCIDALTSFNKETPVGIVKTIVENGIDIDMYDIITYTAIHHLDMTYADEIEN